MIAAAFLAAFALSGSSVETPVDASRQVASSTSQTGAADPMSSPADLDDIIVEGRRLRDTTRDFVNQVAAANRHRGLARWRNGVCVGVVNLQAEAATYIIDRVSTVAQDLGLRAGEPGCHPSIIIAFADDADAFTEDFVSRRPRLFRVGGAGMDRGATAFRDFLENDRPVRWWIVSTPANSEDGAIATRLPGLVHGDGAGSLSGQPGRRTTLQYAPHTSIRSASRLTTQIIDVTKRAFVIVDVNRLNGVSLEQLADYLALVSLAQIDPDADTSAYLSVLNVFDDPMQTNGLTQWDQAYLQGLYSAERARENGRANATEIVDSIVRAHRGLTAEQEAIDDLQ